MHKICQENFEKKKKNMTLLLIYVFIADKNLIFYFIFADRLQVTHPGHVPVQQAIRRHNVEILYTTRIG